MANAHMYRNKALSEGTKSEVMYSKRADGWFQSMMKNAIDLYGKTVAQRVPIEKGFVCNSSMSVFSKTFWVCLNIMFETINTLEKEMKKVTFKPAKATCHGFSCQRQVYHNVED